MIIVIFPMDRDMCVVLGLRAGGWGGEMVE